MKIKVSKYISEFLVKNGIMDIFTLTGGGAMHLNDSFGHQEGLRCTYNHHEQACAIAAESYARIHNKIAAVCVTTGPGGTNAITGVVGGYLDSIPMLIISGQVRYDTTARGSGLNLRALGDQEFDIVKSIECMTKYSEMVTDKNKIRYCLEKALKVAQQGRPGPCWLDIPLDIQGAFVDTNDLYGYDEDNFEELPDSVDDSIIDEIIRDIKTAKRPVLNAGNGIRISGGFEAFKRVVEKLNIPVVTGWNSIDCIHDEHPLYTGRAGIMGDRAGNFAVQNSDLLISVGSRLSIRQVGYNYQTWARAAKKIVVDIDKNELEKHTINADIKVWADAKDFLEKLENKINETKLFNGEEWLECCQKWKKSYPVVTCEHYEEKDRANVYCFVKELSDRLNENQITVVGNGSACVVGSHAYKIKKGQRFIINSAIAAMGYDLPAAIGAYCADSSQDIILVTGDGSIQMNLQELQTIIHNRMPIKIFMINNEGYHSIRQTQQKFFGDPLVGIGPQSGDLSFPDMSKIAKAYGYKYYAIENNRQMNVIDEVLAEKGPVFCEVFVSVEQSFEPKASAKRLDDGTLVSPPLEDMSPFLCKEELEKNMHIPLIDER
ncbi:MAG TPA: thiamine pyrophosphate-binding protein [Clostridia bacterium]|nr:thiamine pyrophosphate-binding protein [Clostridia bacterium]